MKLTCTRRAFSNALAAVTRATAKRATLPILTHILLEAENGLARLSATDLEITITARLDARVEREGSIAVPAKAFSTLLKTLPAGDITLSRKTGTTLVITTSQGQTPIAGEVASEFPRTIAPNDSEPEIAIPVTLFKAMIAQTVIAASNDEEHRPVYTGIRMQVESGLLTLVGFDGFRLTVCEVALPGAGSLPESIVPAHALRTLSRILPDNGSVRVGVASERAQVWFRTDDVTLLSRLIDGQFRYDRHNILTDFTTRVTLDRQAFAAHMARAALFARENANIVRLMIRPEGSLAVEAWDDDVGRYGGTLEAEVTGDAMQIIFNVRQLADVLGVLAAPQMSLHLSGPRKPAVIRPESRAGTTIGFTYVLSPMTINH